MERAEARPAVLRLLDLVAGTLEELNHEVADVRVVVHDEDPGFVHTFFIPMRRPVPYPAGRHFRCGTSPDQRTAPRLQGSPRAGRPTGWPRPRRLRRAGRRRRAGADDPRAGLCGGAGDGDPAPAPAPG